MRTLRSIVMAAVLISPVVLCTAAQAQFNGSNTAVAAFSSALRAKERTFVPPARYGALSISYSPFFSGGRFPGTSISLPGSNQSIGPGGTQTNVGPLFANDFGFRNRSGERAFEIGGWYWTRGHSDLYEVHGRGFFNDRLGVQVGYLGSTTASGSAMDAVLFYDITSANVNPNPHRIWAIEVGAGPFLDFSGGKTTNSISFLIQGTYDLGRNFSLNLSQWYVRDRSVDNIRIALGLGYRY